MLVRPRLSAFVCFLIVLADIVLVSDGLSAPIRQFTIACLVIVPLTLRLKGSAFVQIFVCCIVTAAAVLHISNIVESKARTNIVNLADGRSLFLYGTVCDTKLSASGLTTHRVVDIVRILDPSETQYRGKVLMTVNERFNSSNRAASGDRIFLDCSLAPPRKAKVPWDFDESAFFERMGVSARVTLHPGSTVAIIHSSCKSMLSPVDEVRQRIMALHRKALGKKDGDFLSSIVIGNRNVSLVEGITSSFRNLGLSHMVAASGFNLTIVVGVTWVLLRGLIGKPVMLNAAGFITLVCYVAVAGLSPSVQRAAAMCSTFLIANCFLRSAYLPAVISLALTLTLLADPFAIKDVGLQLSYAATIGLVVCAEGVTCVRNRSTNLLLGNISETAATILIAQSSVLPLQLLYFWQIGLLALPANILVAPFVPVLTVAGFATSALSCLVPVTFDVALVAVDRVTGVVILAMLSLVNWLDSFKWSVLSIGPPPLWAMLSYYASLGSVLYAFVSTVDDSDDKPSLGRKRIFQISAGICLLLSMFAMFWKGRLEPLSIVCVSEGAILIDSERNCLVVASKDALRLRRAVAYLGCRSMSIRELPAGRTASFEWESDQHCVRVRSRISGEYLVFKVSNGAGGPDLKVGAGTALVASPTSIRFLSVNGRIVTRSITNDSLILINQQGVRPLAFDTTVPL